jgi:hypothetical protein
LAKRLRQALLEQTELRFKVKVRGDDGVEEQDGEDDDATGAPTQKADSGAAGDQPGAPPGGPATAEQIAYVQRLRKVRERYEQALQDKHPESTKLRAVMGFASEKAEEQKDYEAATKALAQLEALLGPATATGGSKGLAADLDAFTARVTELMPKVREAIAAQWPTAEEIRRLVADAGTAAKQKDLVRASALLDDATGRLARGNGGAEDTKSFDTLTVDLAGARRRLVAARDEVESALSKAGAQVGKLQALMAVHPDLDLRAIAGSQDLGINALTGNHRVKLLAALRDLGSATPDTLPKVLPQARRVTRRFLDHVTASPRLAACDENPLGVAVATRSLLTPSLTHLAEAIDAYAG